MCSYKSAGVLIFVSLTASGCGGEGPGFEPVDLNQSAPVNSSAVEAQSAMQGLPAANDQRPLSGAQSLPNEREQSLEQPGEEAVQNPSDDDDDDGDIELPSPEPKPAASSDSSD